MPYLWFVAFLACAAVTACQERVPITPTKTCTKAHEVERTYSRGGSYKDIICDEWTFICPKPLKLTQDATGLLGCDLYKE